MKTIDELTSRVITATGRKETAEVATLCTELLSCGNKKSAAALYEISVFNFLFENRIALGIEQVIKFESLLVDGQILLSTGKRLVVEVKMRMNWEKACQAEYQFRQFLKRTDEAKKNPVDGAIVIFEEFSGDWGRKASKAKNLWGWEAWYSFYRDAVEGKPMDLVRLANGELQAYPD